MAATVEHFRGHPALAGWDVWNEPEQSFQARVPDLRTQTCYCPHCRAGFGRWLEAKYGSLARLNDVWGRCYEEWGQVELPLTGGCLTDFVDWREFHLDTMTAEARWRLDTARQGDPAHPAYLHVVPNTMAGFSSVTGVDDFAIAPHCDLWAASSNASPTTTVQVASAGRGKVAMHQRILGPADVRADFLPQIGLGIRGFLFWQYRSEVLGAEAPAWGVVKLDGSDRPVTRAVRDFWATLAPHADVLMRAFPPEPPVGVWKSRKNELFHFAAHNTLEPLIAAVEGYVQALYWGSYGFRFVSDDMLARGDLAGLRLLIMPSPYYLTEPEAAALDAWVRGGGVLLCEAHLGGYNGTAGRHSRTLPGCGLAEAWGIREADSTSSYHLRLAQRGAIEGALPPDVEKALQAMSTQGARFFPVRLADGCFAWGASRYAVLEGEALTAEGSFSGAEPCLASAAVGGGYVFYAGTNLGEGAIAGDAGLRAVLSRCADLAGVKPTAVAGRPGTVHVDLLGEAPGPRYMVVVSRSPEPEELRVDARGSWLGLFTGARWDLGGADAVTVPAGMAELFQLGECPVGSG
jgi:hypothetical protein